MRHCSSTDTLNNVKTANADIGFGVCLLLCWYVFPLCSLNGDL